MLQDHRRAAGEDQWVPIAEYKALIAAADLAGHFAVGVLLESCLADNLTFVERKKRLTCALAETKGR